RVLQQFAQLRMLRVVPIERVDVLLYGGDRHTRLQANDHVPTVAVARILLLRSPRERHPELCLRTRRCETFGHYPDDAARRAAQPQALREDAGIGAEHSPPQAVTEDDVLIVPENSVAFDERPAHQWSGAEHLEVRWRHLLAFDPCRCTVAAHVIPRASAERDGIEDVGHLAPVEVVGNRALHGLADPRAGVDVADGDKLLGMIERQRRQNYRVQHGEDGGIRADTQRQRGKRGDGESLFLPQQLEAETQVLDHEVIYVR